MLEPSACRTRIRQLCESLEFAADSSSLDALVLCRPEHLLYLANLTSHPTTLNDVSLSALLIRRDGTTTLFTDNWVGVPPDVVADEVVVVDWYTQESPALERRSAVVDTVCDRLQRLRIRRLGAERSFLPGPMARVVDAVTDIDDTLLSMREIKHNDEIEAMRVALGVAEAAHAAARECLEPGLREIDLYALMVERATRDLAQPFTLKCDTPSGDRAAAAAGSPTERVMQAGEVIILDLNPIVEGYRADITNTLSVGGKPSPLQQQAFERVTAALRAGEEALRPGVGVTEVFRAMDEELRNSDHGWSLGHQGGHGLGLGHPEPPHIVPNSERTLKEGMVLALEPGVYGEAFGGVRVEHNYLITADGCQQLSHHRLGL